MHGEEKGLTRARHLSTNTSSGSIVFLQLAPETLVQTKTTLAGRVVSAFSIWSSTIVQWPNKEYKHISRGTYSNRYLLSGAKFLSTLAKLARVGGGVWKSKVSSGSAHRDNVRPLYRLQ